MNFLNVTVSEISGEICEKFLKLLINESKITSITRRMCNDVPKWYIDIIICCSNVNGHMTLGVEEDLTNIDDYTVQLEDKWKDLVPVCVNGCLSSDPYIVTGSRICFIADSAFSVGVSPLSIPEDGQACEPCKENQSHVVIDKGCCTFDNIVADVPFDEFIEANEDASEDLVSRPVTQCTVVSGTTLDLNDLYPADVLADPNNSLGWLIENTTTMMTGYTYDPATNIITFDDNKTNCAVCVYYNVATIV